MKTVDARGLKCPMPLIETKKALKELAANDPLCILIDNEASKDNVSRFLSDNGMTPEVSGDGDLYKILVNKPAGQKSLPDTNVNDYCQTKTEAQSAGYIVVFSKDYIGEGSEELGRELMHGFLETYLQLDDRPAKMVFMNSAVFMVLKDSPFLDTIKKIEALGIDLLVCGHCLKYFNKSDELAAGFISNGYEVISNLAKADKVINF